MGRLLDLYNKEREESTRIREELQWRKNQAIRREENKQLSKIRPEEFRAAQAEIQKANDNRSIIGKIESVAKSVADPFVRLGGNLADSFNPQGDGNTLERVKASQSRKDKDEVNELVKNTPTGYRNGVLKLAAEGKSTDEIRSYVAEARKKRTEEVRQTAGDVAAVGSFAIPVAKAAQVAKGGTTAARALAPSTAAGAVGSAGYTVGEDPNATGLEIARNTLIGGALGAALPIGAAAVRAGTKKAGEVTLDRVGDSKLLSSLGKTKVGKKVTDMKDEFVAKVVDDLNYVKKPFKGDFDEEAGMKVTEKIKEMATDLRQFTGIAQRRLQENPAYQELGALIGKDKRTYQDLGDFIKKKQNALNAQKLGKDAKVPVGTPEQEQAYQLLNQATKPQIEMLYKEGVIDKTKFDRWMADPDYTRVQREVTEELNDGARGSGGFTLSTPTTDQKLKGSSKEAIDPFAAFEDWVRRTTLDVQKNKLGKYIRDQSKKKGITEPLRESDKVAKRMELYGEASQLRTLRSSLEKTLNKQKKYIGGIQKEVTALNARGRTVAGQELNKAIKEIFPTNKQGVLDVQAAKKKIESIDSNELRKIKRMVGTRQPKLTQALDELEAIKADYSTARKEVADLVNRARNLSDKDPNGQKTLKVFEKGVKELYTIDPRAAKQLSGATDLELKAIANWILAPSRVLRAGATSMNPAFAVPNFVRDQASSAILSGNVLATHNPISFYQGLKEAVIKPTMRATIGKKVKSKLWEPSDKYKDYLEKNRYMNQVDLFRNLKGATRQAQENMGIKGENVVRKWENIISATENFTRFQNFFGTYKKALRDTDNAEQALQLANRAARENSINFSARGEWANFSKMFNPYINAGIQGSARLARALKERPIPTGLKLGTGLMMPMAVSTYYNLSDPERAYAYSQLPDYVRENNIVMIMGDNIITLPLSPGLKEFTKPVQNLIASEYLGDRQSFLETAKNLLVDPFSPIGTTANELMGSAIPQAVKPVVEVGINRNIFSGRDVVDKKLEGELPEKQVYATTGQLYRDIGRIFNTSPLKVKKIVSGYTAGGGEGVLGTADALRGKNTGGRSFIEQISKRFRPPEGNEINNKFFNSYMPLRLQGTNISKEITDKVKANDMEGARKLADEMNSRIDKETERFNKTYGRYYKGPETDEDTDLREMLNELKIDLTDRSIAYRRGL